MKTTPCTDRSVTTYAFFNANKCGAKTRSGLPCKAPSIRFKKRCRMHGSSLGGGAPKGNGNALKHGYMSNKAIQQRLQIKQILTKYSDFKNYIKSLE